MTQVERVALAIRNANAAFWGLPLAKSLDDLVIDARKNYIGQAHAAIAVAREPVPAVEHAQA